MYLNTPFLNLQVPVAVVFGFRPCVPEPLYDRSNACHGDDMQARSPWAYGCLSLLRALN